MTGSGKLAAAVAVWAVVGVPAAWAQPSADLTLATNASQCYHTGQTVTVQLVLAQQSQAVYGVEAHLQYDNTVLDYQATQPGGLWLVMQNQADEVLGTLDFAAVSLTVPASDPYTVATFTFTVLSEPGCGVGLMSFRASPQTLASVFGPPFTFVPTLHNLPDLAIGDATAPTIGCPPNQTVACPNQVPPAATNLAQFLAQGGTASDNCGAVTITHLGDTPSGNQILRGYRATDICGNTADCQQIITISDTVPPTITCPPDVTTVADAGVCYATGVVLGNPTVGDNCGVASVTNDAPAQFPVGQTPVTWTVTDTSGLTAQCVQLVTVNDTQPPVAQCPANITRSNDPGACGAVVTFAATVSDNCPGATITCVPASGSFFPVGTTTVTCTATDVAGNTNQCQFAVTVNDTELPVATCPANITQNNDPGQCGAVVTFVASVSDNCPGATITCVPSSGSFFPVGTTTVACTATDAAGNTSQCQFTVTVNDTEPPGAQCPANITVGADPGQCSAVVNFTATATDNCPGVAVACSPPSGTAFPVGTTTVTCTATDAAGNTGTCSFTVTVNDTEPPVATCPADITQNNDPGQCGAVVTFVASVSDNCPGATITCVPSSGSFFPVGATTVICTATDAAGNTSQCQFIVTINDAEPPTITCPPAVTTVADAGVCYATGVVLGNPTVGDNCGVASVTNDAPAQFPVGQTSVTWTVTDTSGLTAQCAQLVSVNDTEPPVATCPANITVGSDPGQCGAVVTFAATVSDNCPGATIVCVPSSGSFFPVGTTTVTCTATDAAGNTSVPCNFTVTVNDTEPPVATCPAGITQNNDPGQCGAVVTFTTSVTDNCPGATVSCAPSSGSFFPVGATTVTCTATDAAGNTGTCAFTVTVNDTESPVATCPADVTQAADPGQCSAVVNFTATATDNCPGVVVACSPPSGTAFSVGTTTVTCTATDAAGNTNACTFTVTVNDTEPPVAQCPPSITQGNDPGQCGAVVTFNATATDSCPGATVSCVPSSGSFFPVGTTTVTCTATDAAGNTSAACSFTVTVNDAEPPVATCPASITQDADPGQCGTVVTFAASVTDNCSGATVACVPPSGTAFPVGATTVTCTATDAAGNTNACTFTVTVNDAEPPVATCPADMTVTEDPGQGGATVTFSATVTDNCPNATIACVPPSGSFFPLGTTTVTCTAADAAGNTDVCTFTITVLPADVSISGQVRSAFDTLPMAGVRVRATNSGVTDFTDGGGLYEVVIPAGPPETVVPCLDGWVFMPPQRTYANPLVDLTGEDYTARHVFDVDVLPSGDGQVGPGDLSYFATSWNQSVPPGQALHDFDCNNAVNGGDLSCFATAWLKSVFAPGIALPPCRQCGAKAGFGTPQASVTLVPVDMPSAVDQTDTLPAAVARVEVGQTYYLELWALDRSSGQPGLTSVFVDLGVPSAAVQIESWQPGPSFPLFADGELTATGLQNLGGATLEAGVAAGLWVRVAVVTVRAIHTGEAAFTLAPGSAGIAVYGHGLVPEDSLHLSTRKLRQRLELSDDDLEPTISEPASQVSQRRF